MKNILLTAALVFAAPALAQDAPKGDANNGQKAFMADGCWQCHGIGALGAPATGPKLARTALTFEQFEHQLRRPASEMPPYEKVVVTDQTVADLYAYVKGLSASPNAKDLPLLQGMGVK